MDGKCFRISYISQVTHQFKCVNKLAGIFFRTPNAEIEYSAKSRPQVFCGQCMIWVAFQSGVLYKFHSRMLFQSFRQRLCIFHMALYAETQGFQSLQQEEGVERTLGSTKIP